MSKPPAYDPLLDPNLRQYFSNPQVQKQLLRGGMIDESGRILSDVPGAGSKVHVINSELRRYEKDAAILAKEEADLRRRVKDLRLQKFVEEQQARRYALLKEEENIRLGNQVERVLQTAQMEKEEIVLRKKDIDIHALIQHVADNINPIIHANQGNLTLHLEAKPSLLALDEVHISNVIHNLLDNAIKYSPNQLHVEIQTESNAAQCTIKIKDQGIGMEKSVLETVFEPFYRVPTGNIHNVKGFGLGLSYVKKIVDAHGGKVKVESTLGAGSTFIITLPYGN